jgi:hypothetical protein
MLFVVVLFVSLITSAELLAVLIVTKLLGLVVVVVQLLSLSTFPILSVVQ